MIIDKDKIEKKTLLNLIDFKSKNVLEIGCSYGRLIEYYHKIPNYILGIDSNLSFINSAKKNKNFKNCEFICGDFLIQEFSQKFDLIIFSMSLHHLKKYDQALKKAYNLLNTSGEILIIELTVNNYLNVIMSLFDDERKEIVEASNSISKFGKYIKLTEKVALKWNFNNFEDLISYLKWDNELNEIDLDKVDFLKSFIKKFESKSGEINLIDIWKFVLIKKYQRKTL